MSFHHLKQGSTLRRKHMTYEVEQDEVIMAAIAEAFPAASFASVKTGFTSKEPIFILGMPRTGSTLVERIVSSHSTVFNGGELSHFADQLVRQANTPKENGPLALIHASKQADWLLLGKSYLQATRPFTGHTAHFVDKLPLNFLYAGLIHLALPEAKIVHVTRDPMDTCFAIYKQLFTHAYPFSYDLEDLARYYIAYRQLMRHWHSVMPGVIYDINYEALVADQELQTRQLLQQLNLEFESNCLQFHKNQAASTTASALQVRQPIYAGSVGRWRRYSDQLQKLRQVLEDAGIAVDKT